MGHPVSVEMPTFIGAGYLHPFLSYSLCGLMWQSPANDRGGVGTERKLKLRGVMIVVVEFARLCRQSAMCEGAGAPAGHWNLRWKD